ncbi:MAG: hypothetical protein KTR20_10845 [Cellvibrionaceae bacterium]|nr:hypothetical protein [Cellvibrionaceae bacterium]
MTTQTIKSVSRARLPALLIPAIILLPMAIAYMMFHSGWGVSGVTTNKGVLLSPPQAIVELDDHNSRDLLRSLYKDNNKRWRILIPVTEHCGDSCQQNLYLSRQVHIRLAEKAYRVERVLLLLDELTEAERASLQQAHPETQLVPSSQQALTRWLAPTQLSAERVEQHYYLIDPQGFAMMYYGVEHTGQDLLDDIKKLLKYSYES